MGNLSVDTTLLIALCGLLIGIWGALLSTILAMRELRNDRRYIKVTCSSAKILGSRERLPEPMSGKMFSITAINVGHRPVQVTALGVEFSNKVRYPVAMDINNNIPCPKLLSEGETVSIFVYELGAGETLQRLREQNQDAGIELRSVYAKDSTGKTWTKRIPKPIRNRLNNGGNHQEGLKHTQEAAED